MDAESSSYASYLTGDFPDDGLPLKFLEYLSYDASKKKFYDMLIRFYDEDTKSYAPSSINEIDEGDREVSISIDSDLTLEIKSFEEYGTKSPGPKHVLKTISYGTCGGYNTYFTCYLIPSDLILPISIIFFA